VWAPSPDRATIRYVDADGARIRTSVRGVGSPLLLLTGIGASLELSAPLERALNSHGVQTLALDAPGTGESSRYRWPRRMPGLARTVERTLEALGYDRVDVHGNVATAARQFGIGLPDGMRRSAVVDERAGKRGQRRSACPVGDPDAESGAHDGQPDDSRDDAARSQGDHGDSHRDHDGE